MVGDQIHLAQHESPALWQQDLQTQSRDEEKDEHPEFDVSGDLWPDAMCTSVPGAEGQPHR